MSAFTDSMLDDGFDNPSDYLDYLCSLSYRQEDEEQDYRLYSDYFDQPIYFRKRGEAVCPNCSNYIIVRNDDTVQCKGFPVCNYVKEINHSGAYLDEPTNSFKSWLRKQQMLRSEIKNYNSCPICNNKLKTVTNCFGTYQKCSGYPSCNFIVFLET